MQNQSLSHFLVQTTGALHAMNDMTEEEEEQYIREHARRMKISPWRLLDQIRPLGFELARCDRTNGVNEMEFIRSTPGHEAPASSPL